MTELEKEPGSRDRGVQPLDQVMKELHLKSEDLVKKSTEQLTFKMIARGRKGRFLTRNVQFKICNAINKCQTEKQFGVKDLFNY